MLQKLCFENAISSFGRMLMSDSWAQAVGFRWGLGRVQHDLLQTPARLGASLPSTMPAPPEKRRGVSQVSLEPQAHAKEAVPKMID